VFEECARQQKWPQHPYLQQMRSATRVAITAVPFSFCCAFVHCRDNILHNLVGSCVAVLALFAMCASMSNPARLLCVLRACSGCLSLKGFERCATCPMRTGLPMTKHTTAYPSSVSFACKLILVVQSGRLHTHNDPSKCFQQLIKLVCGCRANMGNVRQCVAATSQPL